MNDIHIETIKKDKYIYKNIIYKDNYNKLDLESTITKTIDYFLKYMKISKNSYVLVVGLGNDNHTADCIGPKVLKHLKVNAYLRNIIKFNDTILSALEPGVMLETGIKTEEIVKGVIDKIHPDLVILVDAYISDNSKYLNKKIMINNNGIQTNSSIIGLESNLDYDTLGVKVLSIGVITAIEMKLDNSDIPYILTSKNVNEYVFDISKIIGKSLNTSIDNLK